jgi:hypothetical protein
LETAPETRGAVTVLKAMADTQPKPFVFVLMPFADEFKDIYELGIKAACREAGSHCERVDEQLFDENILERVYSQISKADLLVADMTGRNPNVFYEVGYAHALGKRVILLTQRSEDIPFDLKHYAHIVYEGRITLLKDQLLPRVKWAVENPKEKSQLFEPTLELYVNDVLLVGNPNIRPIYASDTSFEITLDIHNSAKKTLETVQFKVGVVLPFFPRQLVHTGTSRAGHDLDNKSFRVNDNRSIQVITEAFELFPADWQKIIVRVADSAMPWPLPCAVQVLMQNGVFEFPFQLSRSKVSR